MNRRSFLSGIIAAPVVITTPGLLMHVRPWIDTIPRGHKPTIGEVKQFYTSQDARSLVMQIFTGENWVIVNPAKKILTLTPFGWSIEQITHHLTPPVHLLSKHLPLIEFPKILKSDFEV